MTGKLQLPKWGDIIVELYKTHEPHRYCQRINRNVKASINHLRFTVKQLEKANLIEIIPTKKIKKLNLTKKGEIVAASILRIKSELR